MKKVYRKVITFFAALRSNSKLVLSVSLMLLMTFGTSLDAQINSSMGFRGTFNSYGELAMAYRGGSLSSWLVTFQAASSVSSAGFLFSPVGAGFSPKWAPGATASFNTQQPCYGSGSDGTYNQTSGKYYTFIVGDVSSGTTTYDYVFETSATPVSVSAVTQSPVATGVTASQPVVVTATTSASLPTGQGVFLRYSTNAFSTSTVVNMTGSGTSYTATIPAATNTAGASVVYYIFTSGGTTAPASVDCDKSTINFNNNSGANYSYTPAAASAIYIHDFGTTAISAYPYTVTPPTFNANLSSSSWANSTGAWTSFAGSAGQALSLSAVTGTQTYTLTFNVASGYACSVTSFSFWNKASATGPTAWSMTINGTTVGSGSVSTTGASTGTLSVSNVIAGQTGTMTAVLTLTGGSGGTFRLDDYTLTGALIALPTLSVSSGSLASFGSVSVGSSSTSSSFNLSGVSLTGAPGTITVSAPSTDFQVSNNNSSWGATTTISYSSATLSATPVYVRFTPQSSGAKSGNVTFSGGGASTPPTVAVSGTGVSPPTVTSFTPTSGYTGTVITANGTNLTGLTSASVGGTTATLGTQSGTSTLLTVGAGSTGLVSVTSPAGTATSSGNATPNFTYNGYITTQAGDWSAAATWLGGSVPPTGAVVTIAHAVSCTTSVATSPSSITINNGAGLTFSASAGALTATTVVNNGTLAFTAAGTLTIAAGGSLSNNTGATFNGTSGTINFAGAGTIGGTLAMTLNNLTINTGALTLSTIPTIGGILTINGGNLSTAPVYGASSTLFYNVGYGRFVEWSATGVGTIGTTAGYPNNVTINSGTYDIYNSASGIARACAGTFTVNNGATVNFGAMNAAFTTGGAMTIASGGTVNMNTMSGGVTIGGNLTVTGALNMNTMSTAGATVTGGLTVSVTTGSLNMGSASVALTVNGAVAINNTTAGSLTLSGTSGGDLIVKGNWTNAASAGFACNSRQVTFGGSSAQTLTGATTFDYLKMNNSTGLTLSNAVTVNTNLDLTSGKITLGANNLTLISGASVSNQSASGYVVTNGAGVYSIAGVTTTQVTLPVGTSTSYAPLKVTGTGTSDTYTAKVSTTFPCTPTDATKMVNLAWVLSSVTQVPASVIFNWNSGDQAGSFVSNGACDLGRYNTACPYSVTSLSTAAGTNPNNVTASTGLASGSNTYVLGNLNAVYAAVPVITTTVAITGITENSANSGGQTISGAGITVKGVVYNTVTTPTVATNESLTNDGSGTANYTSAMTAIVNPQTQYFVRAYATNSFGSGYGPQVTFRTLSNPPTAQATALAASSATSTSLSVTWGAATYPTTGATQGGYLLVYTTGTPALVGSPNGTAPASVVSTGTIVTTTATALPGTQPATAATISGLTTGTTYHLLLVPYTWDGTNASTYNYKTASAQTLTAKPSGKQYTWASTTIGGSWATSTNWTPNGVPGTSDSVLINPSSAFTITNVPNVTLGAVTVTGSSTVTFTSTGSNTITIGTGGTLNVASGAGLKLDINGANTISLGYAGSGTGTINGTLTLNATGCNYDATSSTTTVNGIMEIQGGSGNVTSTSANLIVSVSGKVRTVGTAISVFLPNATWTSGTPGATYELATTGGLTSITFISAQPMCNVIINTTGNSNFNAIGTLTTVNGNLTLTSTGTGKAFRLNSTSTFTLTVKGSISIANGASLDIISSGPGTTTINLEGDLTTAGTGNIDQSGTGNAIINFSKNASVVQNLSATFTANFYGSSNAINIGTGSTTNIVKLGQNLALAAGSGSPNIVTVKAGATLDLSTYVVTGDVTFSTAAGSNLITALPAGLTSASTTASGSAIQVVTGSGTATFSSLGNYGFYAATGNTGNFFTVTTPTANTVATLAVGNGGSGGVITYNNTVSAITTTNLILYSGSLLLGSANTINIANGGTVTGGGGTMATTGTGGSDGGTINFVSNSSASSIAYNPSGSTATFYNITINGGAGGVGLGTGNTTVAGTLKINGGFVTAGTAPTYSSTSTLNYNTGGAYTAAQEWYPNTFGTSAGVPQNVTITTSGTSINFGSVAFAHEMRGDLSIGSGTFFALSTVSGGDLNIKGNWTRAATGSFTHNSRAVAFNGSSVQTVSVTGGGTETFAFLFVQGSATLEPSASPATDIAVTSAGGLSLSSTNSTSTIDLNGRTITLSGGGNLNINSGHRIITSSAGTAGIMKVTSATTSVINGGTLSFATNTILDLQNGFDFGSGGITTINGTLQIDANGFGNQAPTYASASTLNYNTGGAYTPPTNGEWNENTYAQPGVPYNVTITTTATALNFNGRGFPHEMWGDLTINSGTSLSLNSATSGADFNIKGNWNNSGTFNCGGRLVQFNGIAAQALTGATTFDYLQENNSTGLTLNNNITVNTALILTSGIVATGSNVITVLNTGTSSVNGQSVSSYVNGNLWRYVTASTSYDFPLGTSTNYELATLYLTSQTGMTYIKGSFTAGLPATGPSSSTCKINGTPISSMLNAGYWTLTPDAYTAANYDITLKQSGYSTSVSGANHLGVIKRHDASSAWLGTDVSGTNGFHSNANSTISGGTASVKRTGITSFSDFGVGVSTGSALPVELLFFAAEKRNNDAILTWATASEINNDHFDIERSIDGVTFQKVGAVPGHGNSSQTISYNYLDEDITALNVSVLYYRLKQVDVDGVSVYSDIASVEMTSGTDIFHITSLYPNPFSDHISVAFYTPSAQTIKLSLYDVKGALISEESVDAVTGLNVYSNSKMKGLASGFYTLNISSGLQNYSYKIIKGE